MSELDYFWENEDKRCSEFIEVPLWIDGDITLGTLAAIIQGGCESGAYMPAVTYFDANETMRQHGDAVIDHIKNSGLDVPVVGDCSWSSYACEVLSHAVELWAWDVVNGIAEGDYDAD